MRIRSLAVFGLMALMSLACSEPATKDTKSAGVTSKTQQIKEAPNQPVVPSAPASSAPECKAPPVVKIAWSPSLDRALLVSASSFEDILETEGQLGKVELEQCVDLVMMPFEYPDNLKNFTSGVVDGILLSQNDLFSTAAGRKKQIDDATLVAMALAWETTSADTKADPKATPTKTLSVLAMGENLMGAGEDPTHVVSGVRAVKALASAMDRMIARLDPKDPEMRTKVLTALSTRLSNTPTTDLEKDLTRFTFVSRNTSTFSSPEFEQTLVNLEALAVTNKTISRFESYQIGKKTAPIGDTVWILRFDDDMLTIRDPVINVGTVEINLDVPTEGTPTLNVPALTKAPELKDMQAPAPAPASQAP